MVYPWFFTLQPFGVFLLITLKTESKRNYNINFSLIHKIAGEGILHILRMFEKLEKLIRSALFESERLERYLRRSKL